jgi:hypothetical protein
METGSVQFAMGLGKIRTCKVSLAMLSVAQRQIVGNAVVVANAKPAAEQAELMTKGF